MKQHITLLDSDGYPTTEFIEYVRHYDLLSSGYQELLHNLEDAINQHGTFRSTDLLKEKEVYIATGGWSGNEEIISALHDNLLFWGICWQKSERGGAYWFTIPEIIKQ